MTGPVKAREAGDGEGEERGRGARARVTGEGLLDAKGERKVTWSGG